MQSIRSLQRKRTINKFQSTVGTRKGRRGRNLALRPDEPAAMHELMAEDATPNLRVWQMYEEAEEFEDSLMAFRDLLVDFESATDVFLQRLEPIMRAPLPRVWDAVEGGLAEPVRATISHAHQHTVGGDISIAGLEQTRSHFHNQIRGHVIRPLDQWREALDVVEQERLPALKRLRRRVVKHSRNVARYSAKYHKQLNDSQGAGGAIVPVTGGVQKQGGVKGLFGACTRPRSNTPVRSRNTSVRTSQTRLLHDHEVYNSSSESDNDSGVAKMVAAEDAGMKLNYKHRKLQAARGDYFEAERVVAEQLEGLCRDGAWLKSYMVAALLLGKEAMQMAVVSLGNTKQPLPGFTSRYGRVEHGILKDNVELAAMMPPELKIRRTPLSFQGPGPATSNSTQLLPEEGLHAHKATATPMELSARPDSHALEWVAPTATGASAVPLDAVRRAGLSVDGVSDQTAVTGTAKSSVGRTSYSGMYDQQIGTGHHYDGAGRTAAAIGGRMNGAVAVAGGQDRQQYYQQADSSTSRLGGRTPDVNPSSNRIWGSGAVGGTTTAAAGSSGTAGFRDSGGSDRSGFKPSDRRLDDDDREGLRERGRGVMSTLTGMVEGAAHAVGLGSRSSSSSSSSSSSGSHDKDDVRDDARLERSRVTGVQQRSQPKTVYPTTSRKGSGMDRDAGYGDRAAVRDQVPVRREVPTAVRSDASVEVCGRREFTIVEDRPVVKERVTKIMEHRPVEKKYETALMYVGEATRPGSAEYLGDETHTVSVAQPEPEPEIRDRRQYTEVEDRPLVKERVTRMQESHPVEKKYETALKYVGESARPGGSAEYLGEETHTVSVAQPEPESEIRDRREYTEVEDRPLVKERVTRLQESHPVEKKYETALKYVGESTRPGSAEYLGDETHTVSVAQPEPEPEIRDRREYTEVEDRPLVKERVTRMQESHPVEKKYETALKYVGESARPGGSAEFLGDETHTVSVAQPEPEPEIRDRREYTEVEDRPLVKERVTKMQESHPVEKKYETALKYVGEATRPGSAEYLGDETHTVSVAQPEPEPEIRDRREYTEVEDRPLVKERVTRMQESNPVEKRYETALKYVGEATRPGSAEYLGDETHTVSVAQPEPEPEIRDRREYTEVEDRPLVKERVTRMQESHPVEKKYETSVRYLGKEDLAPGEAEALSPPEEHIVSESPSGPVCPVGVRSGSEPVLAA